ncbi:MtrAB system response regulator MtrA [Tessaracoccus caeni]|uniref:MtrAB system response regulator MtrA n=1 Tax=Tessaracoccus caeni TaxID=3031239 RepID=UPI0023DBE974|nr:MtrAB system response regulator MtrA [Tessaracoccus caeni]MDF1488439.1 MtrAB system response regulator MtrA [Tessaracoccus caeni]
MTDVRGKARILIVDDDEALSEMLQIVLRQEGFDTIRCATGTDAVADFRRSRADLVLLDLMLPGRDGVAVCRDIRALSGVPIIMLTAKSDTSDVVSGLDAGADDYVAKPFRTKELVARVRTRLRRNSNEAGADVLRIGDLTISVSSHVVRRGETTLSLTPLEFDLLLAMAKRPGHVFTRDALLDEVWGYRDSADTRLVNVHVQRLRAKVERDPEHPEIVVTVRGIGYRAGEPSQP